MLFEGSESSMKRMANTIGVADIDVLSKFWRTIRKLPPRRELQINHPWYAVI